MFRCLDADGNEREVLPNGKIGRLFTPSPSLTDLTFFVDQEVNIVKQLTLDEAIAKHVPLALQDAVRAEYERWHAE